MSSPETGTHSPRSAYMLERKRQKKIDVLDQNLTLQERELGIHVAGAGVLTRLH